MLEIDGAFDLERVGRVDGQRFAVLFDDELLGHAQILARLILLHHSDAGNGIGKGAGTAIQNRDFEVVHVHVCVVDTNAVERRKQMFDRGNPDAFRHQRRGVRHARNRRHVGMDFEVVEIDTAEYDACGCTSRQYPERNRDTRVEAHTRELDRTGKRAFVHESIMDSNSRS